MQPVRGSEALRAYSDTIREALTRQSARLLAPDTRKSDKELRRLSVRETADALRINYNTLRHHLKNIEGMPEGRLEPGNRRTFSVEEIHDIQKMLYDAGKIPDSLYPRKSDNDLPATIAIYNLKGGVSKTSLTSNLAEFLAVRGYRVLLIDLDPQGSLSDLFDVKADIDNIPSIYDVLKDDSPEAITKVIVPTYFPNIDIVPGSLDMTEFEFETSASFRMSSDERTPWHRKISNALELVRDYYDVILFDTPPHMSFAVLSAVYASNGLLVPVSAGMLDVVSLEKFLDLGAATLEVIEKVEDEKHFDFIRFILTRYSPHDQAQLQLSSFLRSQLGPAMLKTDFLNSAAIGDGSNAMQPIMELGPQAAGTRKTYDRIFECLQNITHEMEEEIMATWGRVLPPKGGE
jgi:chromosome partitioning protein